MAIQISATEFVRNRLVATVNYKDEQYLSALCTDTLNKTLNDVLCYWYCQTVTFINAEQHNYRLILKVFRGVNGSLIRLLDRLQKWHTLRCL